MTKEPEHRAGGHLRTRREGAPAPALLRLLAVLAVLVGAAAAPAAPSAGAQAGVEAVTVTFDAAAGENRQLGGEDPAGWANLGEHRWWLAGPYGQLPTKSLSFNPNKQPALTSNRIAFVRPSRLVRLVAHNGGAAATTVTLACEGQPTVTRALAPGALATLTTGWTGLCQNLTVGSTNGADTNFDDLVLERPVLHRAEFQEQVLLTFNDLPLGYPQQYSDFGWGDLAVAGPYGAFSTNSLSFRAAGITTNRIDATGMELQSLQAFNGGSGPTTLTFRCDARHPQTTVVVVAAGEVVTIATGFTQFCRPVTVSSTNGWDTNFDNLLVNRFG